VQSTFSPFGVEAEALRGLTIAMVVAAAIIVVAVLCLAAYAVRSRGERLDHASGMRLVLWLGGIGPTVLLATLLVVSLPEMRALEREEGADALTIAVDGEQFWWRVRYESQARTAVETANEIRVPVGRTVAFVLTSSDVIHSFWIPGLAGKVDMIPGRANELIVRATRAGVFRGTCTEFCGLSHALMSFDVEAMEAAAFDRWIEALARPAAATEGAGRRLFDEYGCAGCHAVRGHYAGSPIGPDLTHFGGRRSLAAGALPMTAEAISRFIRDPSAFKPGARMPTFERMPASEADQVAAYLLELR
jgi:cytochrome c oxidase subunit 2